MSRYYNHINQAFEAFEKSTKNDWIEKVKLEYAGKNVDQVLSGKTRERLQMLTFYTEEDLPAFLPSGITTDASWRYYEYLPVYQGLHSKEFSNAISQAFEMGASGIDLQMQEGVDLNEDLFSVLLNQVDVFPISFYLHFGQLGSFMSFLNNAERLQSNGKLRGTLYIHPGISHHIQSSSTVQSLAKLFSHAFSAHYQLLGVTSAPFVNAGASVVQELAYTLSYLVACIHDLSDQGIELSTLFDHLEITLNTQSSYFIDIAKCRAIRILLSQVAEAYQMKGRDPHHWKIKVVSGTWNKTVYDPVGNMLRNTTEAMAAIMGGCNIVSLIPHDFAYDSDRKFSSRMARNISHLLYYEAQLGKIADPAAGSYFLEQLTHQLVERSWHEFLSIEKEGGYVEAVQKGIIANNIADTRSQKQKDIKIRQQSFVGSTRYPNPDERLAGAALYAGMMQVSNRGPAMLEHLRYRVDQYVAQGNRRPKVTIIVFPVASETAFINARLAFIKDLFTCGGIHFEEHVYENKKNFSAHAFDTNVWILCSTNQFYDQQLPALLQRSSDFSNKILYLAGLSQMPFKALQEAGIHDRIYAGADMHKVLTDILHQLGIVA